VPPPSRPDTRGQRRQGRTACLRGDASGARLHRCESPRGTDADEEVLGDLSHEIAENDEEQPRAHVGRANIHRKRGAMPARSARTVTKNRKARIVACMISKTFWKRSTRNPRGEIRGMTINSKHTQAITIGSMKGAPRLRREPVRLTSDVPMSGNGFRQSAVERGRHHEGQDDESQTREVRAADSHRCSPFRLSIRNNSRSWAATSSNTVVLRE